MNVFSCPPSILIRNLEHVLPRLADVLLPLLHRLLRPATAGLLALAATHGHAGSLPDEATLFTTLGRSEGLSLSSVNAITQDRQGFIWVATDDGLNRFDGLQLRHVLKRNSWLANTTTQTLCEDARGRIWVGFHEGGIQRHDPRSGDSKLFAADASGERGPLPGRVLACTADADQGVLIATDRGLLRIDDSDQVRHLWRSPDGDGENVLAFSRDGGGRLWALTTRQVLHLDGDTVSSIPAFVSPTMQWSSFAWLGDTLHVGSTARGVWRWRSGDAQLQKLRLPAQADRVRSLFADRQGRLWIGSDGDGVFVYEAAQGRYQQLRHDPGRRNSLPDDTIQSIFQSRDGVIWLGTWLGGLAYTDVDAGSFHVLRRNPLRDDSLAAISIRHILFAGDHMWVGTDGGGVSLSTDGGQHFRHFRHDAERSDSLSSDRVRFVFRDRAGDIWVGGENGLDKKTGENSFRAVLAAVADSETRRLRSIVETPRGTFWLGTWGRGLLHYDPHTGSIEQFRHDPAREGSLCGDRVTTLLWRSNGDLLIGTDDNGLCLLPPQSRQFRRIDAAPASVWSLYEDTTGLWIGSYGDYLHHLNLQTGAHRRYDSQQGLSNDSIYALLPDRGGRLWLSSNDGLFALDPTRERVTHYPHYLGLQDREFNSGAAAAGSDGRLYFGGVRGITWFNPAEVRLNRTPPDTVLTKLIVGQSEITPGMAAPLNLLQAPIEWTTQLDLPPGMNSFSISFSAMHYVQPQSNRFRFRLRPIDAADAEPAASDSGPGGNAETGPDTETGSGNTHDNDGWSETSEGSASATFGFLPPGQYQLEVQAISSAGMADATPALLRIHIAPPFWQTRTAYGLYLLAALSLLVFTTFTRVRRRRQAREHVQQLQAEVSIRTHELQTSNQTLAKLNSELLDANARLEQISLSDPLTGLGNRRLLFRYLEKDAPHVVRRYLDAHTQGTRSFEADLLFFLIDLDHFKRINDNYGHAVGDQALCQIRDRLQQHIRAQDVLVRMGGEEFLLLSRHNERQHAAELAERLRSSVADTPLIIGEHIIPISCSIGFCAFPPSPATPELFSSDQVMRIADCLLYAVKENGRDGWMGCLRVRDWAPDLLINELRNHFVRGSRDARLTLVMSETLQQQLAGSAQTRSPT